MTTSRVIRGTRAKIFLYVCAILIITGLIACYNNTLSQLDDVRKSNEICHQQEENLSTQLQVISDYKQRLEKSLKTEKAEHQQTKINLENKLNEEKNKNEKYSSDSSLKLNSLQQHFNLLQTQHEDFKEECKKTQQKQLEDINNLQMKLKEVKEELKKVQASKENLKTQYLELQVEKENVEKELRENRIDRNENESNINHLTKVNIELKQELDDLKTKCSSYDTLQEPAQQLQTSSQKNFNIMSKVDSSLYQISNINKASDTNALNVPPIEKQEKGVLAVPNSNDFVSPSSKSTTKSGLKPSQGSLNAARPLLRPTVTPETAVKGYANNQQLPEGVVAAPEKNEDNDHNEQPEIVNNRYQNVKESGNDVAVEKAAAVKEDIEKENGAHEVFDAPAGQNGFEGLAFGDNEHIKNAEKQHFEKNHIDTMGVGDKERKNYDQEQQEYKDLQNEVPLEENEEEDDDDYADPMARHKDPAVRN